MDNRIYLWDLYDEAEKAKFLKKQINKNPYYDLEPIPASKLREEITDFIKWRSTQVCLTRLYNDLQQFKKVCLKNGSQTSSPARTSAARWLKNILPTSKQRQRKPNISMQT